VIKIGERLHELNADTADLDDLVTSAHAKLAAAEQAERLATGYRAALRMLDDGAWQQAADALEQIAQANPGYRDTAALLARAYGLSHAASQANEPKPSRPEADVPAPAAPAPNQADEPEQPPSQAHQTVEQPRPAARDIVERPRAVLTLDYPEGSINAMAFSPDGHWLATTGSDRTARIWNSTTRKPHSSFPLSAGAVMFTADGSRFLACDAHMAYIGLASPTKAP
jgi:hypothetical protein